jgi:serine/threonine protein kinase
MGITFCSLAYFRTSLPERREENISEELHKIISNMLERDSKKRPSSSEVYNDLKSLYIKKNNDKLISSISSGIRGLASFPNFYDELNSQNLNNSMPIVLNVFSLYIPSIYLLINEVLPTDVSPIIIILKCSGSSIKYFNKIINNKFKFLIII